MSNKNKRRAKAGDGVQRIPYANTKTSDKRSIAKALNQYYTKSDIAKHCCDELRSVLGNGINQIQIIEPSAGDGAFLRWLPASSLAYDLDPKAPGIAKADFLKLQVPAFRSNVFVGNPPFGKNAKLAIAFFNHAASQGAYVAMIVPRTFRKPSVQNRLNRSMHLIREIELPKNAFLFEGKDFDVPAVFQIWERRDEPRAKIKIETQHPDFEFTTTDAADFMMWRIGVKAGQIHDDFGKSKSSHYFIRVKNQAVDVKAILAAIPFNEVIYNTAGNPSLAKSELISLYKAHSATAVVQAPIRATGCVVQAEGSCPSPSLEMLNSDLPIRRRTRTERFKVFCSRRRMPRRGLKRRSLFRLRTG